MIDIPIHVQEWIKSLPAGIHLEIQTLLKEDADITISTIADFETREAMTFWTTNDHKTAPVPT